MADLSGLGHAPVAPRMPLTVGRGAPVLGLEHEPMDGAIVPVGQRGRSPASGNAGLLYHSTTEQQRPSVACLRMEVAQRWARLLHTLEAIRAAPPLVKSALPAAAAPRAAVLLPQCGVGGWARRGSAGLVPQEGSMCSRTSCYQRLPPASSPPSARAVLGSLAATPVGMSPGTFHQMSSVAYCDEV